MCSSRIRLLAGIALVLSLGACDSAPKPASTRPSRVTSVPTTSTTTTTTSAAPTTTITTTASSTSTSTTTVAAPFTATITTVTAADLGATYHAGCPVGPAALRMLHLRYWGFDDRAHVGTMVVSAAVARAIVTVFASLFRARFPIREMLPVAAYGGSDDASMAADNTAGFNCRDVAQSSPPRWSAHAYGEAIDVNTVENPYVVGGAVEPPAASAFLDRNRLRPGMAEPGGALNDAFAAIGWFWGGRWSSPDYQHFSKNGG